MTNPLHQKIQPMSNRLSRPARHPVQCGMTLIEILVAIVVLSIGLLGLAGLQLKGLQVGQGSTYRWQAAMMAEELADRIRADPIDAQAGNFTLTLAAGTAPSVTGTALATITDWWANVSTLPGGAATINAPGGPSGTQMSITISWLDTRAQTGSGQAPGPASFTLITQR